ncbi:TRAP transporter large permease subunit [Alloyangia pacifica]|uniref:TRAP transporter large permease subunit n=1 Tax=Alloyangia pacifica TaxID=311180 RepID=UPI00115FE7C4|nr:TRAP transporter large permease subunit [Alloyangia pacifica]
MRHPRAPRALPFPHRGSRPSGGSPAHGLAPRRSLRAVRRGSAAHRARRTAHRQCHYLAGRYRGGAAKVPVAFSTFFGTISGPSEARQRHHGPADHPNMERRGYSSIW